MATSSRGRKMFDKLLVANRGEIACRVMRTARRLGVRTVAVYSDADAAAMHVKHADEAVRIGPAAASESYLVADRICNVAMELGAEAIHPGYGFLSENASFSKMCKDNGIAFVGPPESAIISMGSKSESKVIMEAANVPCTPGYHGEEQSIEKLKDEAEKIGFPVMLKAVMGGGGKGMRVVERTADLESNIEACQREALASFGDGRILIEKYLRKPRHIELQVFADMYGNTVHLFERDCSVQRRHQKVLEESPAPGMPEELRKKMGDSAVAAAKAVGYVGAGTVEFMVDAEEALSPDSPFYFMEMNTRLQVEHPVTEMVTGVDLVELQLRIASGEPLPIKQEDLQLTGHSLEARVYAESPGSGFLPGSGKIRFLREPKAEEFQYSYKNSKYENALRIETGVSEGDTVSVFYDPMISKVVVHGADRQSALRQMERALGQYRIVGVPSNIEFLLACLRHEAFERGSVDTSFIEKFKGDLLGNTPTKEEDARAAALAIASRALLSSRDSRRLVPMPYGFRLGMPYEQRLTLQLNTDDGSEARKVKVVATTLDSHLSADHCEIAFNVNAVFMDGDEVLENSGINVEVRAKPQENFQPEGGEGVFSVTVDNRPTKIAPVADKKTGDLFLFDATGGGSGVVARLLYRVGVISRAMGNSDAAFDGAAKAPMPGKIIKVVVSEGQEVKKDDDLVIIEAMKMEHVIKASKDGTVSEINVQVGDFVDDSKVLCHVS